VLEGSRPDIEATICRLKKLDGRRTLRSFLPLLRNGNVKGARKKERGCCYEGSQVLPAACLDIIAKRLWMCVAGQYLPSSTITYHSTGTLFALSPLFQPVRVVAVNPGSKEMDEEEPLIPSARAPRSSTNANKTR
jgi:hypothetical protein